MGADMKKTRRSEGHSRTTPITHIPVPSVPAAGEAPSDVGRLHLIEERTWADIGCYLEKQTCSNAGCEEPAMWFRWTGRRWWKLCPEHLVPHLRRVPYVKEPPP
jgi:hypothetical protein